MTRLAAILCMIGLLAFAGCGDDEASGRAVTLDWFIFNEPSGARVRIAEAAAIHSQAAWPGPASSRRVRRSLTGSRRRAWEPAF